MVDNQKKGHRLQNILQSLRGQDEMHSSNVELGNLLHSLHETHAHHYRQFFQTSEMKKKYRNLCVLQLCKLLSGGMFLQESLHACLVYFDFCWEIMEHDVNEENLQCYTNVFVLIATKFHQVSYLRIDDSRWKEHEFLEKERLVLNHLQYRAHVITYGRILELIHTHLSLSSSMIRKLLHQIRIIAINEETPQNIVAVTVELVIKCIKDEDDTQENNTLQHSKRAKRINDLMELV